MSPAVAKAEREVEKTSAKLRETIDAFVANPDAFDDKFWQTKWISMVDRAGEAVDRAVNLWRKERGLPPIEVGPDGYARVIGS